MARNFKLQNLNVEVFEGDTVSIDVPVEDPVGNLVDVSSGHTAIWTVSDNAEVLVVDSGGNLPAGIAAPTLGNGTIGLALTSAESSTSLAPGVYNIEVEISITGVPDVVETLAVGTLRVRRSRAGIS